MGLGFRLAVVQSISNSENFDTIQLGTCEMSIDPLVEMTVGLLCRISPPSLGQDGLPV